MRQPGLLQWQNRFGPKGPARQAGGTVSRALAQAAPANAPTNAQAKPVDDALSIEANLKYLEDNKLKKGVIVRPSGLQFRIIRP